MLVNLNDVLKYANEKEIAIGAFNVPNFESAQAIIEAAEAKNTPVILNYAGVHESLMRVEDAVMIMLHFAKKSSVPVCVHLDHGSSFEACIEAIRLGFTSVMIDASAKSFEENIKETQAVVRAAHSVGVSVEAELGHILASDIGIGECGETETVDSFDSVEDIYTSPTLAKEFVEKTGVDCLAIAFGTAHGLYKENPVLDLDRISQIKAEIDIPFVMHGGSGLSKEEFQGAIKNGVRKINYYTYMTLAGGKAVYNKLKNYSEDDNIFFHEIPVIATQAMKEDVEKAIGVFSFNE
ncbi:MAG: class II fructose-bisphosphate aldolase [Pleomorphochaeta sp.]